MSALCGAGRASSGRSSEKEDGGIFHRGKPWRMCVTVMWLNTDDNVSISRRNAADTFGTDAHFMCNKTLLLFFFGFPSVWITAGVALIASVDRNHSSRFLTACLCVDYK